MNESRCRIDWRGFGLEPPEPENPPDPDQQDCPNPAQYRIVQGCVHEHMADSLTCSRHLEVMRSYLPLEEYWCHRCAVAGHQCIAPVRVFPLAA